MNYPLKTLAILTIYLFLVACNSLLKPQAQSTLTKQIDLPILTKTSNPTLTFQPTRINTITPTVTSTQWPTKQVLLQYGIFGGDGGWEIYAFIGRDTPKLILYTDGQLIVQKKDNNGIWFEETTLTISQMCTLLSQIERTGFFDIKGNGSQGTDDPIYKFDRTDKLGEGGPSYILQVNGKKHKGITIYYEYLPYLIPDVKRVFNLFHDYSPPSKLTDYQSRYLLLRIEKGLGDFQFSEPIPTPQIWPSNLPPLAALEKDKVETEASIYITGTSGYQTFQALVTDEQIKPIFQAFNKRLAYKLFQSGDDVYYVAARPLLPHETLNDFSSVPEENEFDLPFSCSN